MGSINVDKNVKLVKKTNCLESVFRAVAVVGVVIVNAQQLFLKEKYFRLRSIKNDLDGSFVDNAARNEGLSIGWVKLW